ncbi:MAG: glycosyltransferase family 2 protein [Leptolinea sp.]|jgi:glycosyltransferase involved in cell wall biosynthesis|nr:glycosyltransferase family 2 protein [Leptolinea sp.]
MKISVIIPVYNEESNLPELKKVLDEVMQTNHFDWEAVLVDDGSRDNSVKVMQSFVEADGLHYRAVVLRRNFGQTAAIAAGIDHSVGELIVLCDADMQNDPRDIPAMIAKIEEGYDVVSGWRKDRKDTFLTRTLPSRIANGLISWVTGVPLHDYGCTLKAYKREVITGFHLYGEMHRFIPVYASSVGARIAEMEVHHHPRLYGKANYGLERTLKVLLDLVTVKFLTSYANKPIYLFGGSGIFMLLMSVITLLYIGVRKIEFHESLVRSPLLQLSVMLFILGFQSILLGLIAELLARTYHESQSKPTYTVRTVLGNSLPANMRPEK